MKKPNRDYGREVLEIYHRAMDRMMKEKWAEYIARRNRMDRRVTGASGE